MIMLVIIHKMIIILIIITMIIIIITFVMIFVIIMIAEATPTWRGCSWSTEPTLTRLGRGD